MGCLLAPSAKADTLFDSGEPAFDMAYAINWSQSWGLAGALTVPSSGWVITNLSTKLASASSSVNMGVVIRIYADQLTSGKHYPGTVLSSTPVTVSIATAQGAWYSTGPINVSLPPGYAWFGIEWTSGASGYTGFRSPVLFELEAGVNLYYPPDYPNHTWRQGSSPSYGQPFRVYGSVPPPSPPNIQGITISGANLTLSWASVTGATSYQIYEANTLTAPVWNLVTNLSTVTNWTGPVGTSPRFLRVRAVKP